MILAIQTALCKRVVIVGSDYRETPLAPLGLGRASFSRLWNQGATNVPADAYDPACPVVGLSRVRVEIPEQPIGSVSSLFPVLAQVVFVANHGTACIKYRLQP